MQINKRTVLLSSTLVFLISLTIAAQTPATSNAECAELPALKRQLETANNRLQDWPNLARYRPDNEKTLPPRPGENRVVFIGDSITDSWDNPDFGGFFPGKPYINRGISGQTTPQMLLRFRPDVIALKPKVVVILAGTNDIAGNTGPMTLEAIQNNLATMAELARAHNIRVVLASLLPVSDYHTRDGKPLIQTERRPPAKIQALNQWLKQYAAANNHVYLDYYSASVDSAGFLRKELSYDGLHPDANGYKLMAPLAEKAIAQALKQKR